VKRASWAVMKDLWEGGGLDPIEGIGAPSARSPRGEDELGLGAAAGDAGTRRPGLPRRTEGPTATTSPANSRPGYRGERREAEVMAGGAGGYRRD